MPELTIWTEKYRPKSLSEMINQEHVVERLKAFVSEKNVPHMLFAGPAGCGKTTSALCIAEELFGKGWRSNILETNASDERGIDTIRHKVKDFARTKAIAGVPYKIIILDEADALTNEAQQALRRTMESFTQTCRFILICNYSSKIIEPIQSRTSVFRFKSLTEKDVIKYAKRIAKGERLKIKEDGIKAIITISAGDLRKVANLLQTAASLKKIITENIIYDVASQAKPGDVAEMLGLALKGDFENARKKLQDMLLKQGLAGEDIIKEIHRQIHLLDIPQEVKIQLLEKTGEYEFRLSEGGDEHIQLEALLAQFLLTKK